MSPLRVAEEQPLALLQVEGVVLLKDGFMLVEICCQVRAV